MVSYLSYSWRMAGKKRKITVAFADKLPLIFVALKSETFHDRLRQDDGKVLATSAVGRLLAESLFFSLSLFRLISTQKNNTTNVCSEEPGIPSESRTTASTWQPSREFSWWVDGVIDGHFPNPNEMKKKNFSLFFVLKLYVSSLFLLCVAPRSKVLPKTCFFFLFQTHFFFRKEIYVVVIVRSPPWRLWPGAVPYPPSLSPNESSDQWRDSVSCALSFRVPPRYFITNTKCLLAI